MPPHVKHLTRQRTLHRSSNIPHSGFTPTSLVPSLPLAATPPMLAPNALGTRPRAPRLCGPQATSNSLSIDEALSGVPCLVKWTLAAPAMPGYALTLRRTPPGLRGCVGNPAAGDIQRRSLSCLVDTMTQLSMYLSHIPIVCRTAGPFWHT